ncbi:hypothetical protein L218DRAFT_809699, partial [Marasmius fiardii PR-910]
LIKPILPPTYDGTPEAKRYQSWIMHLFQYMREGRVNSEEQVLLASHFLHGRALLFFLQKVANNYKHWKLLEFMNALFNFCFPLNYRSQQRKKLQRCYQNTCLVLECTYKLEMLFNLVGSSSKCECVIKLWDGFNTHICWELHQQKLNKEVDSWDDI